MTLALLGTGGAMVMPDTGDLSAALLAAGATAVERLPPEPVAALRYIARLARTSNEPLLICADNLVAHPSLLLMLATDPAGRSTALVLPDDHGDLREERGRLVPGAPGTVRFAGALFIARSDLPQLADAAGRVGGPVDAIDALMAALVRAGLAPIAVRVRLLHAARVITATELAAARAAIAAVDEDAARLRLAVKEKDDFFTTYAVSTWSPLLTRWCARRGLTPTGVTALSVLLAVAAALGFWQASRAAMVAGAVLLYLAFVLDCVDGQLARYTRRFQTYGAWLDTMADRAKEYLVYAGLAAGAERSGLPYAWPLAITAIVLQTVRHMTDFWYGALHDEVAAGGEAGKQGGGRGERGLGARLSAASNRVQRDTGSPAYWLKRIVVFPIGERWAVIAVVAAIFDGRAALAVLVSWGLCALAYTLGLRSVRAASMRVAVLDRADTSRQRDDGPLVREVFGAARARSPLVFAVLAALSAATLVTALLAGWLDRDTLADVAVPLVAVMALVLTAGVAARARHDGALDWLVPAALRAAEYLMVVAVALIGAVPAPVVYLLLFVLAMHHYDGTARSRRGPLPRLGWDGRVVFLVGAALLDLATFGQVLLAVGAVCGATVDRYLDVPR